MTDDAELAAIEARDAAIHDSYLVAPLVDRRTLLRMLNETRTTLFHAQQAVLKEGLARDVLIAELSRRETTWAMRHERETAIADKATARVATLEALLRLWHSEAVAGGAHGDSDDCCATRQTLAKQTHPAPASQSVTDGEQP